MKQTGSRFLKNLAILVIMLISGFIILSVLVHLTNPSINPIRFPLSQYALTSNGILLATGFFMIGTAELITGLLVYFENKSRNRGLAFCTGIMGLTAILTGIFPMDLPPERTLPGILHIYAAIVQFVFFPVSLLLYGISHSRQTGRMFSLWPVIFTVVLLLFIVYIVFTENLVLLNYYGLLQKLYIFLITMWLVLIAYRVIKSNN